VGIVVPFSWSFWGAVVEHAELQAAALRELGHDVRLVMGNDPPGQFTRVLHPRVGRHGDPPPEVIPIGRSVIVPANGSLPNIILSPRSVFRIKRVLERERFDVLHLHEPMTPTPCIAALALFDGPMVGTHHASGDLGWMRLAKPGMVLTRAFACATPVVASDIPGYRDVMTSESSYAVEPGDPAALARVVEAMLGDEEERETRGAAARELAIERYSWQDIARRLERIYRSARGEPVRDPVAA